MEQKGAQIFLALEDGRDILRHTVFTTESLEEFWSVATDEKKIAAFKNMMKYSQEHHLDFTLNLIYLFMTNADAETVKVYLRWLPASNTFPYVLKDLEKYYDTWDLFKEKSTEKAYGFSLGHIAECFDQFLDMFADNPEFVRKISLEMAELKIAVC